MSGWVLDAASHQREMRSGTPKPLFQEVNSKRSSGPCLLEFSPVALLQFSVSDEYGALCFTWVSLIRLRWMMLGATPQMVSMSHFGLWWARKSLIPGCIYSSSPDGNQKPGCRWWDGYQPAGHMGHFWQQCGTVSGDLPDSPRGPYGRSGGNGLYNRSWPGVPPPLLVELLSCSLLADSPVCRNWCSCSVQTSLLVWSRPV